jgi:hypothetical protein
MTKLESNILIAEFMGAYKGKKESIAYDLDCKFPDGSDRKVPELFKYHISWDWLMPVVKKIREMANVELSIDEYDEIKEIVWRINPFDYDLEQVYRAVVQFIQWYNNQKA